MRGWIPPETRHRPQLLETRAQLQRDRAPHPHRRGLAIVPRRQEPPIPGPLDARDANRRGATAGQSRLTGRYRRGERLDDVPRRDPSDSLRRPRRRFFVFVCTGMIVQRTGRVFRPHAFLVPVPHVLPPTGVLSVLSGHDGSILVVVFFFIVEPGRGVDELPVDLLHLPVHRHGRGEHHDVGVPEVTEHPPGDVREQPAPLIQRARRQ
mmetsp:Transcript_2613/g.11804  ORF Transcript_2613/g.11804 Transcript_2613/m.11804 type:complete len:208 (+) Transcript_2613:230-853(+)